MNLVIESKIAIWDVGGLNHGRIDVDLGQWGIPERLYQVRAIVRERSGEIGMNV
jgi:hypothetical protein